MHRSNQEELLTSRQSDSRTLGSVPCNIILLTPHQTRADALHTYGYSSVDTPNIDQLAREGIPEDLRFNRAKTRQALEDFRPGPFDLLRLLADRRFLGAIPRGVQASPRMLLRQRARGPDKVFLGEFDRRISLGKTRQKPIAALHGLIGSREFRCEPYLCDCLT